jgi:predicted glutamine amidotransferase
MLRCADTEFFCLHHVSIIRNELQYPDRHRVQFHGFATRGGRTDEHKDGWGIAFLRAMAYVILSIISPQSAHRWLI